MPFVTEEIWQALGEVEPRATAGEPLLIRAAWPRPAPADPEAEAAFADLSALVREVRNLRTAAGTPAGAWVPLVVEPGGAAAEDALDAGRPYLEVLAHVRPIEERTDGERPALVAATPLGAAWLGDAATASEASTERRTARVAELEANIARLRTLLANEAFVSRAPASVVDQERARLADLEEQLRQLA
jgi:valyl-tRNA synthetase